MLTEIRKKLRTQASAKQAWNLQRFFKTGPGEYGAGDIFLGLKAPQIRRIAQEYRDLGRTDTLRLLKSPIHEERFLALLILIDQYEHGTTVQQAEIYRIYLVHTRYINNWDLVDVSAGRIVGAYLMDKDLGVLDRLARSKSLWERRISVLAAGYFIRAGRFAPTLKLAARLLDDKEDLIHKAVGWMLREIGKRDRCVLDKFLKRPPKAGRRMPRTMLRYAIERHPAAQRWAYLRKSSLG